MAYANGTPTSVVNLLQTLVSWLVSIGWTSDNSAALGSGWAAHLHKGSVYAHFRAAVGERSWSSNQEADASGTALNMFLSTGYTGASPWDNQTGAIKDSGGANTIGAGMAFGNGSPPYSNYYFFSDSAGDNVVVVVEKSPGLYLYLFWGPSITKNGAFTGGMYFGASSGGYYASYRSFSANTIGWTETSGCPGSHEDIKSIVNGFLRCDVDSWTGKWVSIGAETTNSSGYTGRNGASSVYTTDEAPAYGSGGPTPTASIVRYAVSLDSINASPHQFQHQQTSALDGRANLLPVLWWVGRDGSSGTTGGFSPVGSLPMVWACDGVGKGFVPAQDYTIGTNTYKLFPNFAVLKVV